MKIARIHTKCDAIIWAAQQDDGALVRVDGDPLFGSYTLTREIVEPSRWFPPVEPRVIMCIGYNYAAHAAEGASAPPAYPVLFMKNPCAAIGHREPIVLPKVCTNEVDYEGELVVVIKKHARDVPRETALEYVLGYTAGHDVSARVWQQVKGGSQWCRGKSFDTFAPLGPVLVTADEIPDPSGLSVKTTVNGKLMQDGNTNNLIFDVPALISFLSQDTTLLPGTIIMTGTPAGVGWAREPKVTLKPNDTVDVTVEKIGCLTNPVVASQE